MSRFVLNQNFRFRVSIDNLPVADLSKMGIVGAKSVTLQAGRTQNTTFQDWARLSSGNARLPSTLLKSPRKSIRIEVFGEGGQKMYTYSLYKSWVTEYQATPELSGGANAVAIQTITIEYESFTRDPP